MTDEAITALAPQLGVRAACAAAGAAQAGYYRRHRVSPAPQRPARVPHRDRVQPRALSPAERAAILGALHAERFADLARLRCGRRCWTRAPTSARCPPSTG